MASESINMRMEIISKECISKMKSEDMEAITFPKGESLNLSSILYQLRSQK